MKKKPRKLTLSQALKQVIEQSGLSLLKISKGSGIEFASLSRFMSGERSLRLDKADELASFLGIVPKFTFTTKTRCAMSTFNGVEFVSDVFESYTITLRYSPGETKKMTEVIEFSNSVPPPDFFACKRDGCDGYLDLNEAILDSLPDEMAAGERIERTLFPMCINLDSVKNRCYKLHKVEFVGRVRDNWQSE